jgi:hypothetical protein
VPYVGWNVPAVLATRLWRNRPPPDGPKLAEFLTSQRHVLSILEDMERRGVSVIYPHERLCRPNCLLELDGQILYSDDEHLTSRGADLFRPALAQALSRSPAGKVEEGARASSPDVHNERTPTPQ